MRARRVSSLLLFPIICFSSFQIVLAEEDYPADYAFPAARFSFTEVGKAAGITGDPLAGGHGVAFADVDNDGDLDIFVTNTPKSLAPNPNYLFINQGNGKFWEEGFERRVEGAAAGPHGIFFADFDNDGDLDLLVGFAGDLSLAGQSRLYINDGKGYFKDGTQRAHLKGKRGRTRGVTAGDFDADGRVDFVLTDMYNEIVYAPDSPISVKMHFRNKGKGRFRTVKSGLVFTGFTQGIAVADIDGDGYLDLVESKWPEWNYDELSNTLWMNDGDGSFTESSDLLGERFEKDGTNYHGTAIGDTDNDGDLDLITVGDSLRFFKNNGKRNFVEITAQSNLSGKAFSGALGDLDNDGDLDFVIPNLTGPYSVFENLGNNHFKVRSSTGIFPPSFNDPRGVALGDYDGDGDLDIAVVHKYNRIQLFRNNLNSESYVKLLLFSPTGERGAVGAKVRVYKSGKLGKRKHLLGFREAGTGSSYLCQNSPEVHIGLPPRKKQVDIEIEFLDGSKYTLKKVKRGQRIKVDPREDSSALKKSD